MDPQFNLTVDFCENIENFTQTEDYSKIEEALEYFANIETWVTHLLPIFVILSG